MLLQWLALLALMIRTALTVLDGENVCSRRETYTVTLPVWVKEPVQVKTYTWCLGVPPRCTKYRTEMRDKLKTQTEVRERVVMVCCRGYAPDRNETRCLPVCQGGGCLHGLCVSPDTCRCAAGYTGIHCDAECENNRWGADCTEVCSCRNEAQCNHVTGDCKCQPGWRGTTCETPCPRGTYGEACMMECHCISGDCDHITGLCHQKTPPYAEEKSTVVKQTTANVPVTSVDNVTWFKNYNLTTNIEELGTTETASDNTAASANLEIKSVENERESSVSQTTKDETEASRTTTTVTQEYKKHANASEGESSKHMTKYENSSTEANGVDIMKNTGEHINMEEPEREVQPLEEEDEEESGKAEDNEAENAENEWETEKERVANATPDDHSEEDEYSGIEEHQNDVNLLDNLNKQESDQEDGEIPPPEIIVVSDGLQGENGDSGTLGLVSSVSIAGGMALALIVMAAIVIFTVARRRRSGKQTLQAATKVSAVHYSSNTPTLPMPQMFLNSDYQNSTINDMPLHTLRDSEPYLPPRFGEATLTTFGHLNHQSVDENRTTRAFLELQYDIPPSAVASKNNSILPIDEPEHLYDEIPAWRNAGEC